MRLDKSYDFDDAEALDRMRALTDYWWAKHGVKSEWDGPNVRLKGRKMGVKYDARVTVGDGKVVAEVEAGFLAEKLGAPRYVEGKVDDYLDPANTVESLRARIP
jgi:hypothetical protein